MVFVTDPERRRPTLRRELLLNLAVLAAAALSLAMAAALIAQLVPPAYAVGALVFMLVADLAVVVAFGRYLVGRLVTKPMDALRAAAEELEQGHLERRAPDDAETEDFSDLGERFNRMTERLLDAQSQLVRAEKLASIGRLAAGVAHEIGNPLSAIQTYAEVLRQRGADPEILKAINHEAGRVDRIVRELLNYARPQREEVGPVDAAQVVRDTVEMLRHQGAFKDVTVTAQCSDGLPPVIGRAHQLEQVVVNLVLNAVSAAAPGRVTVGAVRAGAVPGKSAIRRNGESADPDARRRRSGPHPWRAEFARGPVGVLVFVADSGPGVPAEFRDRVFDPFFTTKPPGSGTGLGLAIVQRLVDEFGGVVWVDDAREGGAAFKAYLPVAP